MILLGTSQSKSYIHFSDLHFKIWLFFFIVYVPFMVTQKEPGIDTMFLNLLSRK